MKFLKSRIPGTLFLVLFGMIKILYGQKLQLFEDINKDSPGGDASVHGFVEFKGKLYFIADNGKQNRLWEHDGEGSATMCDSVWMEFSDEGSQSYVFGDDLLISAKDSTGVSKYLWRYNGKNIPELLLSEKGERLVLPGLPPIEHDGRLYFSARTKTLQNQLWSYNTQEGVRQCSSFNTENKYRLTSHYGAPALFVMSGEVVVQTREITPDSKQKYDYWNITENGFEPMASLFLNEEERLKNVFSEGDKLYAIIESPHKKVPRRIANYNYRHQFDYLERRPSYTMRPGDERRIPFHQKILNIFRPKRNKWVTWKPMPPEKTPKRKKSQFTSQSGMELVVWSPDSKLWTRLHYKEDSENIKKVIKVREEIYFLIEDKKAHNLLCKLENGKIKHIHDYPAIYPEYFVSEVSQDSLFLRKGQDDKVWCFYNDKMSRISKPKPKTNRSSKFYLKGKKYWSNEVVNITKNSIRYTGDYTIEDFDTGEKWDYPRGTKANYSNHIEYKGKIYFEGENYQTGKQLWCFDGKNPPYLFQAFNYGRTDNASPYGPYFFNGELYFMADMGKYNSQVDLKIDKEDKLRISDHIRHYSNKSVCQNDVYQFGYGDNKWFIEVFDGIEITSTYDLPNTPVKGFGVVELEGHVFCFTTEGNRLHAWELKDGSLKLIDTYEGVKNRHLSYGGSSVIKDKLYFSAENEKGKKLLWSFAPREKITPLFAFDDRKGSIQLWSPEKLQAIGGRLFFKAESNKGAGYFVMDEENQLRSIKDVFSRLETGQSVQSLYNYQNQVLFSTQGRWQYDTSVWKYEACLWRLVFKENEEGPQLELVLRDSLASRLELCDELGGKLVFRSRQYLAEGDDQFQYYQYDGNTISHFDNLGLKGIRTWPKRKSFQYKDETYFLAKRPGENMTLWKYNGSDKPVCVDDLCIGGRQLRVGRLFALHNDRLYLTADDGMRGIELWYLPLESE